MRPFVSVFGEAFKGGGSIVLTPNKERNLLVIDFHGDLGGILAIAKEEENQKRYRCAAVPGDKLVGPEGLEPPT